MMGLRPSLRMRIALLITLFLGFILFLPLRIALDAAGLERLGVSAREVRGSVWDGQLYQLMLGDMAIGSVNAGLSPLALLNGRLRFDIDRTTGQPNDIKGALTVGFGRIGVDDVTGLVPLGNTFAPLPVGSVAMEDVSGYFLGDRCGHAEGRVTAQMVGQLPGLILTHGLSGDAICDGDALLLPLVSSSGLERINIRIWRSGRYVADMRVEMTGATMEGMLAAAGFKKAGNTRVLKLEGNL